MGVKLETARRCKIAKDWERESIPLDLARKYLKAQTTLHAELLRNPSQRIVNRSGVNLLAQGVLLDKSA